MYSIVTTLTFSSAANQFNRHIPVLNIQPNGNIFEIWRCLDVLTTLLSPMVDTMVCSRSILVYELHASLQADQAPGRSVSAAHALLQTGPPSYYVRHIQSIVTLTCIFITLFTSIFVCSCDRPLLRNRHVQMIKNMSHGCHPSRWNALSGPQKTSKVDL